MNFGRLEEHHLTPIRWNTGPDSKFGRLCKDHPKVRGTDYREVTDNLGTMGCSKCGRFTWSWLGAIDHDRGVTFVNPGDWVLEPVAGVYVVPDDTTFRRLYPEV